MNVVSRCFLVCFGLAVLMQFSGSLYAQGRNCPLAIDRCEVIGALAPRLVIAWSQDSDDCFDRYVVKVVYPDW